MNARRKKKLARGRIRTKAKQRRYNEWAARTWAAYKRAATPVLVEMLKREEPIYRTIMRRESVK